MIGELREPDALAYLLLAIYSGSAAARRLAPLPAVVAGLLAAWRSPACSTRWC